MRHLFLVAGFASLSVWLGTPIVVIQRQSAAIAAPNPNPHAPDTSNSHDRSAPELAATPYPTQFRPIEQPLWLKAIVTLGGVGLIGLELWWFLGSKPRSTQATTQNGVQAVRVMVDGGYEPSQIVVRSGQPVQLNFYRKDPSQCLEEVRFPDFHIARTLPVNQTTAIEFTPEKPGRYEFTCGMNMFRGVVEVL